jgi:hypothetical protein
VTVQADACGLWLLLPSLLGFPAHRSFRPPRADGNVVVVQLALQGTHDGPLQLPFGELPATGKQMNAPCCDVFELEDGKIKRFDCYPEGSIIFAQLGVLNNLDAALSH